MTTFGGSYYHFLQDKSNFFWDGPDHLSLFSKTCSMWIPVFSRLQNRTFSTPFWAFTHTVSCTAAWRETDGGQRHLSRAPHHTVEEQCVTQHITRNGFAITWICIIANAPCLRCSAGRYYQVSRRMSVNCQTSWRRRFEVQSAAESST